MEETFDNKNTITEENIVTVENAQTEENNSPVLANENVDETVVENGTDEENIVKDNSVEENIIEKPVDETAVEETQLGILGQYYAENPPVIKISRRKKRKAKKKAKKNLAQYSLENDINYRGPMNIIAIRIMAWVCIVLVQVVNVLELVQGLMPDKPIPILIQVFSVFSGLSLPCFLLGSFSYIIQRKGERRDLILSYFLLALGIIALFYIFFLHFGASLYATINSISLKEASSALGTILEDAFGTTLEFNIFIDMFMFALLVYFIMGEPQKHFQGKNIVYFRLLMLIPILYEVVAYIIKALSVMHIITFPIFVAPLLPTKYPMVFLSFIAIILCEKRRKNNYFKNGGTKEGYEEYFKTNRNSWLFAKSTAKCFAVFGFFDAVITVTV
ncbi:MAG: hypothetical protein MJ193_04490, partial [Clostridia bacterium]|nr:hypothetical protein [Clostridia bacterium]